MTPCKSCKKPKAPYTCGICQECVCKACVEFVGVEKFSFLAKIPAELQHDTYCPQCFDAEVATPLEDYNRVMEEAREVYFFTKDQSKQTAHLSRKEEPLTIENCEDKDEALLRLSFFAAKAGFNCVIDVVFKTSKIIVGSHKKVIWNVTGVPIQVKPNEIREQF